METQIKESDYKGNPIFSIIKIDEDGIEGKYPVVSFGKSKAVAIVKHIEDIKTWLHEQGVDYE